MKKEKEVLIAHTQEEVKRGGLRSQACCDFPKLRISQDESIFHNAHDTAKIVCLDVTKGEKQLCPKGPGEVFHVSVICCACCGVAKNSDGERSYIIIEPARDGTWVAADLIKQLCGTSTRKGDIKLFKKRHGDNGKQPDKYEYVLLLDHSANHCSFSDYALLVSELTTNNGNKGGSRTLRNGWYCVLMHRQAKGWSSQCALKMEERRVL